jgi:hypothetical protein
MLSIYSLHMTLGQTGEVAVGNIGATHYTVVT